MLLGPDLQGWVKTHTLALFWVVSKKPRSPRRLPAPAALASLRLQSAGDQDPGAAHSSLQLETSKSISNFF